jgi:lipopolysaccharide transport system permease protein
MPTTVEEPIEAISTADAPAVEIVPYRPTLRASLAETWRHRRVLTHLGGSVLTLQYRQTLLGLWWVPITVLFATVGRTLIFGRLLNVPSAEGIPYFLFMLTGMLGWTVFDRSLLFTLRSFSRFSRVTRDLSFPLSLVPLAATMQGLLQFALHGALVAVAVGYYSFRLDHVLLPLDERVLLAPLGMVWCMVLAWGLGMFLAPTYVRKRDMRFILRMVLPFWMYVTPIVYPLSAVGDRARLLGQVNPVSSPIELLKEGVFGAGEVSLPGLVASATITVLLVVGGLMFMNRFGPRLIAVESINDDVE